MLKLTVRPTGEIESGALVPFGHGYFRGKSPRRAGPPNSRRPARAIADLHPVSPGQRAIRSLGGKLPSVARQSQCAEHARRVGCCRSVEDRRPPALRPNRSLARRHRHPSSLGMSEAIGESSVRNLGKIEETAGVAWLREHSDYCVRPLPSAPWCPDADVTVNPPHGRQDGAVKGYNAHKPRRPSHIDHT
jgi:hypothetical protein